MNAITPVNPALSRHLADLVEDIARPGSLGAPPLDRVSEQTRRDARDAIPAAAAACESAGIEHVRQWLKPVLVAVRNPPPEKDFQARCALIAGHVPEAIRGALTAETLREGLARWQFWPAVADVVEVLKPHADRLLADLRALRGIADAAPPAPPERPAWQATTQAEIDGVSAKLAAWRTEAAALREEPPAPRKSRPVTPAQLQALYQEQARTGNPIEKAMARTRLAAIADAQR